MVFNFKAQIRGVVQGADSLQTKPLKNVKITLLGAGTSVYSNEDGTFEILLGKQSPDTLLFTIKGYRSDRLVVTRSDRFAALNVVLVSGQLVREIVVSGGKDAHGISKMKTLHVEELTSAEFRKAACCNLSESFETNATVDVSMADAISGAKKIQLLGLDAVYTQLQFENIPFLRGLESAFGMSAIPGTWLESIQITKGTGSVVNGYEQMPMHGQSLAYTFGDTSRTTQRGPQYFEMMGHRAIWADGFKAVTFHDQGVPYDKDLWSLYKLDEDFSEMHDLSSTHPEKLQEMIALWWSEAERFGVLPLDDRGIEIFGTKSRPGSPHYGNTYTYYPPIAHIPSDACPMLSGRAWTLTVDVVIGDAPAEGVIYARGGHNIGHSFFIKDSVLHFYYNALGKHQRASAPISLSKGEHQLSARFDREGDTGTMVLLVDGKEVGSVHIPKIMRILGSMGMDLGCDRLSPVAPDYVAPFPFNGSITKAHFEIRSKPTKADVDAILRAEAAKE